MTNWCEEVARRQMERFDEVIDVWQDRGFIDITGKIGGDVETIRIHANGEVTQR